MKPPTNPPPIIKSHRYRRYYKSLWQLSQKKKVRVYSGVIFSIITISFFIFFTIRPTFTTIASLLKEIENKKTTANQLEEKIKALSEARLEYDRLKPQLHLLDEALPTQTHLSQFIRQIEALARKYNLMIDSYQLEKVTLKEAENKDSSDKNSPQEINFSLAIKGNYRQAKSFFYDLHHLIRLVAVKSLKIQSSSDDQETSFNIKGTIYYLVP